MKPIRVVGVDVRGLGAEGRVPAFGEDIDLIVAPERLVRRFSDARIRTWPSPFEEGVRQIEEARSSGKSVAVIATGDPMDHGVGGTIARRFGHDAMFVSPVPSAFSLAAARMGWPLEETKRLSLHGSGAGRDVASLERAVDPGTLLLILSEGGDTPRMVADWLSRRGFGSSQVTVLERMGGDEERNRTWAARAFPRGEAFDPLNTIAVECEADTGAEWQGMLPGLPDQAFVHDGQITKQDIRAITIPALKPFSKGVLWDVGAGCGTISIEWLRLASPGRAFAIEPKAERGRMIKDNVERFGVGGLQLVENKAPAAFTDLPRPDAVFVGGGVTSDGVAEGAIDALKVGGTFVANAVTLEGEAKLATLHMEHGGSLRRIAISHASEIGAFRGWRPAMPVTMLRFTKR